MPAGPLARSGTRLVRTLAVPLVLALPPLFWIVEATRRASRTTLGRDQGIFQYVAWAIHEGAIDYRDVRDVNGPLVHAVHRHAQPPQAADHAQAAVVQHVLVELEHHRRGTPVRRPQIGDHRVGLTLHQLTEVMDGKLGPFVDALMTHYEAERLKQELVEA